MAIRVAVVGLGSRGQDWVREVRTDPGYELVARVDTDADALRFAATRLGVPHGTCFVSLSGALDAATCDAVIVANSADRHTQVCEEALARGLALMVEKPFTVCLADAVRLVRLAEQKKSPLVVAQNYRYMRSYRTARRLVPRCPH